ncbi:mechanosensitive ion channel family protein [Oleomonas cavernae]|uniref:mechanosensitive ion channel family protein n=1 Tax=Oleomonas cavernae TaxID=2320859 RepID=UPI001313FF5B|nr:mechanosensitive ion channel domain-containing protein [Oleomonas cavernae]
MLAIGSILLSFEVHGLLLGDFEEVARGLALGFSIYLVIAGFAHVALQPHQPQWRVAPLSEESADTLDDRLKLLAVMLGINSFIWIALDVADAGTAFAGLLSLFGFSIIALGLWPILGDRAWYRSEASMAAENASGEAVDPRLYVTARRLLRLVVLTIPVTALAGYYNLSEFLTRNVVLACALFAAFSGLTTLVSELTSAMLTADSGPLKQVRRALGVSEDSGRIVHFWIAGFLNILIAIGLFLAFLPSAGVPTQEIADFLETGLSGVKIGNFTISFADILLGIIVFIVALRVTRMAQRLLEKRILPQTRLDTGVKNSIRSAAGYAGATLGLVIAVSTAGIDFSNIAIIAGALSVGIGFGLQNIVNNFISGLIVLVERPVKVGDWVIVGGYEGTVKRINVRATEIETFKRATVIVPNGELISQSITNFTLRNKLGRIDIPVGVAYGSDPAAVEKILIEIVGTHKAVLSFPKPRVIFQNFGASSLDFELRFFIANIEDGIFVRSEIMYAIERTFRERHIEIPFAQSEVNFKDRDLDRIEAMLARFTPAPAAAQEKEPDDRA